MKCAFIAINKWISQVNVIFHPKKKRKGKKGKKIKKKIPFWLDGVRRRNSTAGYWRRSDGVLRLNKTRVRAIWSVPAMQNSCRRTIVPRVMRAPARFRRKLSRFIRPAIMRDRVRYAVHARKSVRLRLVALIARDKSNALPPREEARDVKVSIAMSIENTSMWLRRYVDVFQCHRYFCLFSSTIRQLIELKRKFN